MKRIQVHDTGSPGLQSRKRRREERNRGEKTSEHGRSENSRNQEESMR